MIRDISIVIPIYNEQDNIIQLINEVRPAGHHSVAWNAGHLSAGMYFIQFSSTEGNKTMKVLLIK